MSEKPRTDRPRRLSHWINAGERKVHSLVDKVYSRKNLALAWENSISHFSGLGKPPGWRCAVPPVVPCHMGLVYCSLEVPPT